MHEKVNRILLSVLVIIIALTCYFVKSHQQPRQLVSVAELSCSNLIDPRSLPFISHSTKDGFDQCVLRCMHSVMGQVCEQIPEEQSTTLITPKIKQEMYDGCLENINHFVTDKIRCPYLNCEP